MSQKVLSKIMQVGSFGFLSASVMTSACGKLQSRDESHLMITNGIEVSKDEFPSVVLLLVQSESSQSVCTATFINDHQALTAAHCLLGVDKNRPSIFYAQQIQTADGSRTLVQSKALRFNIHPDFNPELADRAQANDLAVIDFPTRSAPGENPIARNSPQEDTAVTIVGFGASKLSDDESGSQTASKPESKRKGSNKISRATDGLLSFTGLIEDDEHLGLGNWSASAKGDSGGPLFVDGELAGVTSGGEITEGPSGNWIAYSHYVDLASPDNRKFIDSVID